MIEKVEKTYPYGTNHFWTVSGNEVAFHLREHDIKWTQMMTLPVGSKYRQRKRICVVDEESITMLKLMS